MLEPGLGTPDPFVSMPAPSVKASLRRPLLLSGAPLHAASRCTTRRTQRASSVVTARSRSSAAGSTTEAVTTATRRCAPATFRADDGTTVDHEATITADRERGDRVPVQQTVSGYLATGFGEIWRWCALFFLGWIVAALGIPFAATGIMPSRGQAVAVGRLIAGTRASAWMKRLVLGGAGGAALSLYLAWIF